MANGIRNFFEVSSLVGCYTFTCWLVDMTVVATQLFFISNNNRKWKRVPKECPIPDSHIYISMKWNFEEQIFRPFSVEVEATSWIL